MKKLGVIFGGKSTEHDVSIVSGLSVIKNLNKEKYEITPIYMSKDGDWFLYTKDINQIETIEVGEQLTELQKIDNPFEVLKGLDVVFPVLHGLYGEDGTIQGMLELLNIPYVGCKVLSSSICMDKAYAKILLEKAGINQADFVFIKAENTEPNKFIYIDENLNFNYDETIENICEKAISKLGLPVFVKPSNSGSSVGITKVSQKENLPNAILNAVQFDNKILIEKGINAREIECSVLGNYKPESSCVGEVIPAEEFYDFNAKYHNSASKIIIPAQIDEELSNEIRKMAIKAYEALDCKGLARIDFLVDKNTNKVYLSEINTMPGFTSISMYPQLWEKCGKPYSKLLDELIENA